jgi:lipopolysaccharide/colanic/teichoic acid biosynthesis glycosyltransferase
MKRIFDVVASSLGLLVLLPLLLVIYVLVALTSAGGGFFFQERVGRNGHLFKVWKFRTMYTGAEREGQLTTGRSEARITKVGEVLRKFKLDELPQLVNVVLGDMSVVGPRPEVPRYVALYDSKQRDILTVRPGLTSIASLEYSDENRLLEGAQDPEKVYVETIMPAKLELDLRYIREQSIWLDIRLILKTIVKVFT